MTRSVASPTRLAHAAASISEAIRRRHLPYGTILDPRYAAPKSDEIVGYARAGDSAIWTGHYLAAESFRHAVTRSTDALDAVRAAIDGLIALTAVTGRDLLARALVPCDSPHAGGIIEEERRHGVHRGGLHGRDYYWIGNTSRDQYSGALFGLAAAHDLVDDPPTRSAAGDLVRRLLGFLLTHRWVVRMPDRQVSTTFLHRPDQILAFLQIGRHVDPGRFAETYVRDRRRLARWVALPIRYDGLDAHRAYFKFNLNAINLFSLIRLEEDADFRARWLRAYEHLRRVTGGHGNPHFDMIDRALGRPDPDRDARAHDQLSAWLDRPRRDDFVDLRGELAASRRRDRAREPIPVERRVRTDFLWQRSPFLLVGGGDGTIEGAGIDFILPYWMARYHGVIEAPSGDDP